MRVKELKAWHWIMMITAKPRIQSRKGNRFTGKKDDRIRPLLIITCGSPGLAGAQPAPPAACLFRAGDAQLGAQGFSFGFRQRDDAAQQIQDLREAAEVVDAMPAPRNVAFQLLAAAPGGPAVQH